MKFLSFDYVEFPIMGWALQHGLVIPHVVGVLNPCDLALAQFPKDHPGIYKILLQRLKIESSLLFLFVVPLPGLGWLILKILDPPDLFLHMWLVFWEFGDIELLDEFELATFDEEYLLWGLALFEHDLVPAVNSVGKAMDYPLHLIFGEMLHEAKAKEKVQFVNEILLVYLL